MNQSNQRDLTELDHHYVESEVDIAQLLSKATRTLAQTPTGNVLLVASSEEEASRIARDINFHGIGGLYVVPAERIDCVRGSVFYDVIITHPERIDPKTLHYVEHESKYLAPRRIWPDMKIPDPKPI